MLRIQSPTRSKVTESMIFTKMVAECRMPVNELAIEDLQAVIKCRLRMQDATGDTEKYK